jgi:glyoxylase I family protein
MSLPIKHDHVHHLSLTVTDMDRSLAFYAKIGFNKIADLPPKSLLSNGTIILGIGPVAPAGDSFSHERVGLDHLSFQVASRSDLDAAMAYFEAEGIPHGGITELEPFGIVILPFFDPDGIALEFTAPL